MKSNLNLTALLALLTFASCQKEVQRTTESATSLAEAAAKPSASGSITTINLSVTVDNTTGNQILDDNNGAYINGTDRVDAQILSSDGNFYMNTNNNTVKPAIRTMRFLPNSGVVLSNERNYSLRTNAPIALQNMAVGSVQNNVGFRVWGVQQGGVVDWRLLFRNGLEDPSINPSTLTDYAKVTRVSNDVWTIEPANISATPANARLIDGSNNSIGLGYYQVPFKLTLTRIGR